MTLHSGTTAAGYAKQGHLPCDMAVRDVPRDMILRALFCVNGSRDIWDIQGTLRDHELLLWLLNSHQNDTRMGRHLS